jgi:hypothetical protein
MALRHAPHRVLIARRVPAGIGAGGEGLTDWSQVASDVPFDVQITGVGSVEQRPYGRVSMGSYPGFAASGTDLRPDDGVKIVTSEQATMVGRRFGVRSVLDWGERGGVQAQLEDSEEDF